MRPATFVSGGQLRLTFVLVIAGKGKVCSAEQEPGVLRRQVPHWLSQPKFRALVVGFEEAHVGDGGEVLYHQAIARLAQTWPNANPRPVKGLGKVVTFATQNLCECARASA